MVMFLSRGTYEPKDYHRREYWTWKPAGEKPWVFRVFTKGRFWEDERRNMRRSTDTSRKQACDEFAMSELDLDSAHTSRVAPSLFAASSERVSAIASEYAAHCCPQHVSDAGEMHEMSEVVMPKQVHAPHE